MSNLLLRKSSVLPLPLAACILALTPSLEIQAAPYASGVTVSSITVSFTLNESADLLTYSLNGGAALPLDPTRGAKTFLLNSATDTFSITATKTDPVGYTIPTGAIIAGTVATSGLSQPTPEAGFRLISDDTNPLVRFNSPRGVAVAADPNNPQFGTAYVSNSAAGTAGRSVGDGLYALKADQSDAFGYGNTAQAAGLGAITGSGSSPFRLTVGQDRNVYVTDFADGNGGLYRMSGTLTNGTHVLAGDTTPFPVPAGQNHGSVTAVYATGSTATGDLIVFTLDEDLTSSNVNGGSSTDRNSLWRYDIGGSTLPFNGLPTKVNTALGSALLATATSDLDRGINGNIYLAQNRSAGGEVGLIVLSPDGSTLLFNSLSASRTLLNDPAAADILQDILAITVSYDQKYIGLMLNNSDVAVLPLDANGVPDIANRFVINTGTDIVSGRDIAFDAVGNLHYVSSGQALYRVLSPGGSTAATTSWNGSTYNFTVAVPEPTSAMMLGLGAFVLAGQRRRSVRATL